MRLRSALCSALFAPLLINARDPLRLQPSSAWVVDFAENSCRITRMFGEGSQQTKLAIESVALGKESMVASGRPLNGAGSQSNVATRFLPTQQKPFFGQGAMTTGGIGAVYWAYVPFTPDFKEDGKRISIEEAMRQGHKDDDPKTADDLTKRRLDRKHFIATASAIEIKPDHRAPVVLEIGSLVEVMNAVNQCSRDLLKTLGVDADIQDRIVVPLRAANPATWFSADIYPRKSIALGQESQVTARIVVDAQGRVSKCDAFSQYDAPEFNAVVCSSIQQNAKFYPAELADGTKVASYMVQNIVFRLEG